MYKCESLTHKNLIFLKELNEKRTLFNIYNADFIEEYKEKNYFQRLLLMKNVTLLKFNDNYVGFIWVKKLLKNQFIIKSISISDDSHLVDGLITLIESLKHNSKYSYDCENNGMNSLLLEKVGFNKKQGTIELIKELTTQITIKSCEDVEFKQYKKGSDEQLRCEIQNKVFMNENRMPVTIEDICYDVEQDYFFNEGSVFIKVGNTYVGYGQVIMNQAGPTIVNFGIIREYRGRGYGNLLLNYLINVIQTTSSKEVRIKVHSDNEIALNLYINAGFNKINEYYRWVISL